MCSARHEKKTYRIKKHCRYNDIFYITCTGRSQGDTVGLNLKEPMYIGGVSGDVMVAKAIGVTQGFDGCVSEVNMI